MFLKDAQSEINMRSNVKFERLFTDAQIQGIIVNKGKTGQLLELALGMKLTNTNLDFEDGELKTNKCDATGKPLETVFITQISNAIDDLLTQKPFEQTHLYEKIDSILYVPVCKIGKPQDWFFLESIHIDLNNPAFSSLRDIWREDYYSICNQLKQHIETKADGFIHTSNGTHIQIRSKDSRPYSPIFSNVYRRNVSNKNHAFYFQKQFVYDIQKMNLEGSI